MYYPKQIPYLLNAAFKKNVVYQEFHLSSLDTFCMCIWQMQSKKYITSPLYNTILPDACIDIIVNFTEKEIFIVGFSKDTFSLELNGEVDYLGVRLKPGAFYSLFQIPAFQIMDKQIPFSELESEYSLELILKEKESFKRINILKDYLLKKIKSAKDSYYITFVDTLYENPVEKSVLAIANTFHYTERHLYRIFKTNYGISPKILLNIIRLHLCLSMILDENRELIDIVHKCGFYDQSHFIKEIKRYTGISPLQLLSSYQE